MQSKIETQKSRMRARGSAMSETVLVMPFLLLIIALVLYFGRGMVRLQRAGVMDRYEAWRMVESSPGPHADVTHDSTLLNQTFFGNNASLITWHNAWHRTHGYPDDTRDAMLRAVSRYDRTTAELAEEMDDRFPTGRIAEFDVYHPESVRVYERFTGPIHQRFVRFSTDWRHSNAWRYNGADGWVPSHSIRTFNEHALRDVFYPDFDGSLESLANGGNPLAARLRNLYLSVPGYAGPKVD